MNSKWYEIKRNRTRLTVSAQGLVGVVLVGFCASTYAFISLMMGGVSV